MLQPDQIERALVVTAHPDDVDFGAAGTVAVLTDAGVAVTYCLVTDGEAGGSDRTVSRTDMAALRRREQTDAAMHVGVTDLVWLGHADGRVEADLALREAISRVIREVRPQVVITQSPQRVLDRMVGSHPDHLAAGEATLCAVYPDARNPFAFPALLDEEGLEPWSVPEVWLMALGGQGDALTSVDITAQIDRKVKALLSHASQMQDPERMVGFVRERATVTATESGLAEGTLAETFRVVQI
ncbi:MAG: PIG-L deacetylase family protein [Ilumatobacteraceae bacterium]